MTLKRARQECRFLCSKTGKNMWPLGWNKQNGYYPQNEKGDQFQICWVGKDGSFLYATKENEKKHSLKGNKRG